MHEQVLVVPAAGLPLGTAQYIADPEAVQALLDHCQGRHRFVDRGPAEENPGLKQLIPYVTVVCQGHYLCLERTRAQSEARLHGKLSLGVGGHINPQDAGPDLTQTIRAALERELREELWLQGTIKPRLAGIINDDSNSVGSVHLGLHYILSVPTQVRVREEDKMTAHWLTAPQLCRLRHRMETWSSILLPFLPNP